MLSVVHLGAGSHNANKRAAYKQLITDALSKQKTSLIVDHPLTAADTVESIIATLEDSPLANCGYGSNLTIDGTVECDASICDTSRSKYGGGGYASVGATENIRNPIMAARLLMEYGREMKERGRVPPMLLAGPAVGRWCRKMGRDDLLIPAGSSLITPEKYLEHKNLHSRLLLSSQPSMPVPFDADGWEAEEDLMDTVGVVSFDGELMAAGVSSGGIKLKECGRIGHSGIYNSGCMVYENASIFVGISVSGTGEQIIKSQITSRICLDIELKINDFTLEEIVSDCLRINFTENKVLSMYSGKSIGLICVVHYKDRQGVNEIAYAHTTKTMVLGYSVLKPIKDCNGCLVNEDADCKFIYSRKREDRLYKLETRLIRHSDLRMP